MAFALTNVGERFTRTPRGKKVLKEIRKSGIVDSVPKSLLEDKLVEETSMNADEARNKYKNNPLRFLYAMFIEGTNLCDHSCKSCFKAGVPKSTETDTSRLKSVIDEAKQAGIGLYAFLGGEVTSHYSPLLDMVSHVSKGRYFSAIFTNGWWGREDFISNGVHYDNSFKYAKELKRRGLGGFYFSIDGLGKVHDDFRNREGSYDAAITAVKSAQRAGLRTFLSSVLHEEVDKDEFFKEMSRLFKYDFSRTSPKEEGHDLRKNGFHLIADAADDIGNMRHYTNDNRSSIDIDPVLETGCKAYFRPNVITVKANGEIATCPLVTGGEGYGNIHSSSLIDILNGMDSSRLYLAHRNKTLGDYAGMIDRSIFKDIKTQCTVYTVASMMLNETESLGKRPDELTPLEISQINDKVARYCKFI